MNLNFIQFRDVFYQQGIFSVSQVYLKFPEFNSDNLLEWQKRNYIFKIRNKWYCFRDFINVTGFHHIIANSIYDPSYISHQEALMFYGLIPELVVDSVSVTTKKTMSFTFLNKTYKYFSIDPKFFFGYELKEMRVNGITRNFMMADKEKAILDYLYLYNFYNTKEEISEIRFNDTVLETEVDWGKIGNYLARFNNKALNKRVNLIKKEIKL